jgi:hypothetical protein
MYAALKKDKKTRKNILNHDQEINLFNNLISPKRFKEGGAAILQALNINRQKDILGINHQICVHCCRHSTSRKWILVEE